MSKLAIKTFNHTRTRRITKAIRAKSFAIPITRIKITHDRHDLPLCPFVTFAVHVFLGVPLRSSVSSVVNVFIPIIRDHPISSHSCHFHSAYCFRSSVFSNFPVDVCGRSLTKTKSSGICHLANFALKKCPQLVR